MEKSTEELFTEADIEKLRGSIKIEYTLAKLGAEKFRKRIFDAGQLVRSLGALSGGQAVQQVRAGLKAIYVSGWQVAADGNLAGDTYPDQSLYPANSMAMLVKRINNALLRQDRIESVEGNVTTDWIVPVVADAEAGFGGVLNTYEIVKSLIEAGAAAVHLEDQLASEKKCGHLGGKVLVPTSEFINKLKSARLAADVAGVNTVIIARTDADAARLITTDIDERDQHFLSGGRTSEGFWRVTGGLDMAIERGLAYAPYADLLWCETSTPNLKDAKRFADAIHEKFPGKPLAYNCSPSFKWEKHLTKDEIYDFQNELYELGYVYQFVTLAGFHSLNYGMFQLSEAYQEAHMSGYVSLQNGEFEAEEGGYTAHRHQREVGTSYYDAIKTTVTDDSETTAMSGSTEEEQFHG